MSRSASPTSSKIVLVIRSLMIAALGLAVSAVSARSQDVGAAVPAARVTPTFSRLGVFEGVLNFPVIKFPAGPRTESKSIIIENTGNATLTSVTIGPISGSGAAAFSLGTSVVTINDLAPLARATVTVQYEPLSDGLSVASVTVTSSATRTPNHRVVALHGKATGVVPPTPTATPTATMVATPTPTPTATLTATPTATATATPTTTATTTATVTATPTATTTGTPTATATLTATATATSTATATATATSTASPSPTPTPGVIATDKNSANAPGIEILGTTVTVTVPFGSDATSTTGAAQVVIENGGATPLPTPAVISTDRVNSCTPAMTGEVVCSGQTGTIDLIPFGASSSNIITLPGPITPVNYDDGVCIGCGAMVDDSLDLGIIASGNGFFPINLGTNALSTVIPTNSAHADEEVGVNFGYDQINHLILSANYTVNPNNNFASTPAHFQIINISTPSSPVTYELANDQAFFNQVSHTCTSSMGGTIQSDIFPETAAIDTTTNIVYVTFHTPSACFSNPPNDIALFDMSQATFTQGMTAATTTWTSAGMQIQTLTGVGNLNGIDPISVEPTNHVAVVSGGGAPFGALQLPSTSGTGTPAIVDWVSAVMPNDPSSAAWNGWTSPNGLATYVSPNTSKPMGVFMNGGASAAPTYLAIVDINALLAATRDSSNHKVASSVNLLTSGIVSFVPVQ